ncbi:hydrolase or acyltransferase of alpha/beta superfamily protein [Streptomyces albospinus]|uniref:Hydrolase or acyltransferase of alpha/beta superfamily protein n=1 Tax=Streptomyces albospinus TaxID=285515 RepID=A0ABQ2VQ87_9ACTN|nr:alpha/beta hydrolase [Streptomyces albospinus]GGV00276.1 hydrolase or acyltransferase of alpha/beta superfamily protein [Streptomyces albospinus]
MREQTGRAVPVNGRSVHVEESGSGPDRVVFEAGQGLGRTCWDAVLPLLADRARLVAYDRAGFGRSGRTTARLGIDDMAADLVAMVEAVVPGRFVLVAHSMGGLVARRAAESLGSRLRGLLLLDPTPEGAPVYDTFDRTAVQVDRALSVTQRLVRFRPLARMASGNVRRVFPADTYETMLAEDFVPAGIAQTRREFRAVAAAIPRLRAEPPALPACPTVLLSASRPAKGRGQQHAVIAEHQRRWAETLPDGRFEEVDSGHLVQAERPEAVAAGVRHLLDRTADRPAPLA